MKKNKRKKTTVAEDIFQYFRQILDFSICVYILLILVVMPFYNEEGFTHIGTDKATFFRKCTIYGSRIILPIFLIVVIAALIAYIQTKGKPDWKRFRLKNVIEYCKNHFSATDGFVLLYGISVVLAYLFSDYKEEALWGTVGWYMGLIPQLTLVSVYFFVSRAWTRNKWVVASVLPASAIVFGLGYLNRFGIYPIDMQAELPQFISTIGNINWYCGYLVSVLFGAMFLLWKTDWENIWPKILLMGYVIIGFATLVTQGSNSGILTMIVVFLVLFHMSASDGRRMEMFWLEMVLFSLACLITFLLRTFKLLESTLADTLIDAFTYSKLPVVMTLVSVVFLIGVYLSNRKGKYPAKVFKWITRLACGGAAGLVGLYAVLLVINTMGDGVIVKMTDASLEGVLTFSPKWGSNRGATWSCGWQCFVEQDWLHKLTGVGPDCMSTFLYTDGSEELLAMVTESFKTLRLTNAHNEWLTILVNIGLLGLISYAGIMITAIGRFLRNQNVNVIAAACGICILAYTVNNMVSFQQSLGVATIFVILGIGENYMREKEIKKR